MCSGEHEGCAQPVLEHCWSLRSCRPKWMVLSAPVCWAVKPYWFLSAALPILLHCLANNFTNSPLAVVLPFGHHSLHSSLVCLNLLGGLGTCVLNLKGNKAHVLHEGGAWSDSWFCRSGIWVTLQVVFQISVLLQAGRVL